MAEAEQPEQAVNVIWTPHPGSQVQYLTCPIWEVLFEGTRGPGKTDAALMKFAKHVGQGYGANWRGVIFQRRYKDLDDIIAKSKKWFYQMFPGAQWKAAKSDYKWVWPTGEELLFRQFLDPDDYWNYHGHEHPFIHWEELTKWHTNECYEIMKSCSRSSFPGMPRYYGATANPYGPGHDWVKSYFIDIGPAGTVLTNEQTVKIKGKDVHIKLQRVRVHGDVEENDHLISAQPEYLLQLDSIENEELRKAWRHGDWDINPGGFLQGILDPAVHKVRAFNVPLDWPRWRAMDWGSAKPYSIGWYTISPDGVIYRYRELYGWGGKANKGTRESPREVSKIIHRMEEAEVAAGVRFRRNPADSNICTDLGTEITIQELFTKAEVRWVLAKKGPGSRKNGAQIVVQALKEEKFKVFDTCVHWWRTVPGLMPDPDDWDDVDTEMEDHTWDETMYSLRSRHKAMVLEAQDKGPTPGTFDWLLKVTQSGVSTRQLK